LSIFREPLETNMLYIRGVLAFSLLIALHGCSKTPENPKKPEPQAKVDEISPKQQARIQEAMAKLPDVDRALAEAQKFCPIHKGRLGLMGKPVRIELEGQVVFLCCSNCTEDAQSDAKKTLAQVAEFKKK
jgi:hypothetical protein